MKKRVIKFILLVSVALVALGLVACQKDDDDITESTTESTSAQKDDDGKTESTFSLTLSKDGTYYRISGYAQGCTEPTLIIPDTYKGLPVKEIDSRAFRKSESVVSVVFGDNIETTGMDAFRECKNLKSVVLGKNMKVLGNTAFADCAKLTDVHFNDTLTEIKSSAFLNCVKITEITLPDSVTTVSSGIFSGCTSVTSVILGKNLTYVGESMFENCSALKSVNLENITAIKKSAFKNCESFGSSGITFSNALDELGNEAFMNCTSLTSINWPTSLINKVGKNAFNNCTALKEVRGTILGFGSNSAQVGNGFDNPLFYGCTSLKKVTISAIQVSLQAFKGCTGLEKVTILNAGTDQLICYNAFANCTSLKDIIIPTSVKAFGQHLLLNSTDSNRLHILYEGTKAEWQQLLSSSPTYMDDQLNSCVYFYSKDNPTGTDRYWRYVGGQPQLWQ